MSKYAVLEICPCWVFGIGIKVILLVISNHGKTSGGLLYVYLIEM